jgi:hypothetical protein
MFRLNTKSSSGKGDTKSYFVSLIILQYNETNVMHFSFKFIENKGPLHVSSITSLSSGGPAQTALGILRAYNSVGCAMVAVSLQSWYSQRTQYTIPSAVCSANPEDEQVMLEACRGP